MTEVKKTGVKAFLDMVKTYYGFIGMLLAIGSIVYASGVKHEKVDNSNAMIVSKVNKLIGNDSLRAIKQDVILGEVRGLKDSQEGMRQDMTIVTMVVKNLSKDFLAHVSKDNSVSKQDIIDIMGGLQFEITQPKVNKSINEPEFKITVKKIQK